jgi:hypothetical protein
VSASTTHKITITRRPSLFTTCCSSNNGLLATKVWVVGDDQRLHINMAE